jgi:hypothetical protein
MNLKSEKLLVNETREIHVYPIISISYHIKLYCFNSEKCFSFVLQERRYLDEWLFQIPREYESVCFEGFGGEGR